MRNEQKTYTKCFEKLHRNLLDSIAHRFFLFSLYAFSCGKIMDAIELNGNRLCLFRYYYLSSYYSVCLQSEPIDFCSTPKIGDHCGYIVEVAFALGASTHLSRLLASILKIGNSSVRQKIHRCNFATSIKTINGCDSEIPRFRIL